MIFDGESASTDPKCVAPPKQKIFDDLKDLWTSYKISELEIQSKLSMINIVDNHNDCFKNTSCIAILTEWDEFKKYNWKSLIQEMEKQHVIIDGRNILSKNNMDKLTNNYLSIGR